MVLSIENAPWRSCQNPFWENGRESTAEDMVYRKYEVFAVGRVLFPGRSDGAGLTVVLKGLLARISCYFSTATAQWFALAGFRPVGVLDRVSAEPVRFLVAKAARAAPLLRITANGGEKRGMGAAALGMVLFSGGAAGAALELQPSVSMRLFYDDNAALTTAEHNFSAGSELLGAVGISRETEAITLQGIARLNLLLDAGGDVYRDKDNQLVSLLFASKGELRRWQVYGSWRRDSIVRAATVTEEGDADTEPDDDVDAGLVQVSIRRNRLVLRPSWSYALSPRSGVGVEYRFDNVKYDSAENLFDYQDHTLSGNHFYQITERDQITTAVSLKSYRSSGGLREEGEWNNDRFNIMLGLQHSYSETASGHFQVGWYKARFANIEESGDTDGYLYRIYGEKRTGLTRFSARLGRTNFSSGAGDVVNADELSFNMARDLTETMSFSLRVRAFQSKSIRSDNPYANRRYLALTPTLSWRITRWWSLDTSYRYRRQKRDREINYDSAESNSIYLSVRYERPAEL